MDGICAVCRRNTYARGRYRLRAEAVRGGRPTQLHQQLTALVGVDFLDYEFVCRSCRLNIVSATKLKQRYEEARRVIMVQLPASESHLSGDSVGQSTTGHSETPPRQPRQTVSIC